MALKIKFTNINENARHELNLTYEEYAVANSVYHLSNSPDSPVPGWCSAKKQYIAEFLGGKWLTEADKKRILEEGNELPRTTIPERSIYKYLKYLEERELIVKHDKIQGYLKTTAKWYNAVVVDQSDEKTTKKSMQNLHTDCKNGSPTTATDAEGMQNVQSSTAKTAVSLNEDINKYKRESEEKKSLSFENFLKWLQSDTAKYEEMKKFNLKHYFGAVLGYYHDVPTRNEFLWMRNKIVSFVGQDEKSKIYQVQYAKTEAIDFPAKAYEYVHDNIGFVRENISKEDWEIAAELFQKCDNQGFKNNSLFESYIENAVKYYRKEAA